jgi:hypothetical protein
MRVIIDTSNMATELQGGLLNVEGSSNRTAAEKKECVEIVSQYVMDGWAIAADPHTPIGWLAAFTAEKACVPLVSLTRLSAYAQPTRTGLDLGVIRHGSLADGRSDEFPICASNPARKHNV